MPETPRLLYLTFDILRDTLQSAGYRVETIEGEAEGGGAPLALRSATSGLQFEVRPGNKLAGQDGFAFLDATFSASLKVEGELPFLIVNEWNVLRRFGRLYLTRGFLVLDYDFSAAGGVSEQNVRAQTEIWDQLVNEFAAFLRAEVQKLTLSRQVESETALAQAKPANEISI